MCSDGDLRLVNGSSEREGRVEICYGNVYGTVRDDQWGLSNNKWSVDNLDSQMQVLGICNV